MLENEKLIPEKNHRQSGALQVTQINACWLLFTVISLYTKF